jgi:hypothetical protein
MVNPFLLCSADKALIFMHFIADGEYLGILLGPWGSSGKLCAIVKPQKGHHTFGHHKKKHHQVSLLKICPIA